MEEKEICEVSATDEITLEKIKKVYMVRRIFKNYLKYLKL